VDAKEPFLNTSLFTYLWVIGISLWGGAVSYLEKREPFTWLKFFAHISSASFAGLMTFFLCDYGHVSGPLTGVLCGVAAHMGTPLLLRMKLFRGLIEDQLGGTRQREYESRPMPPKTSPKIKRWEDIE
jgi:hypothetical protein